MSNKSRTRGLHSVSSIAESFSPILWYDSIFGMGIFEIPFGRPWPKLSMLYGLIRFAAYGYLLYYFLLYIPKVRDTFAIITTVYQVILYSNIAITAVSSVLRIVSYKKTKSFLKRVALADETLEVFGIDPEYASTYKNNVRIILLWCACGIFVIGSDFAVQLYVCDDVQKNILNVLIFQIPLLVNPMMELKFAVKLATLGKRFERLNALIQSVTTTPLQTMNSKNSNKYQDILKRNQNKVAVKPNSYLKNRNNIEFLLKTARQLHLDLCATSRDVNDCCSKEMSMQMAATFLLMTGFTYCLYLIYNEPKIPLHNKIQSYTTLGIWIIFSIVRMTIVVRTSVKVTNEAQKTSQIAHEIQVPRSQTKLIDEIHQLSLQIMQHPLTFTASGLVVLDFAYVRGFVGSVTTYLMILIQNQSDMLKVANTFNEDFSNNSINMTALLI